MEELDRQTYPWQRFDEQTETFMFYSDDLYTTAIGNVYYNETDYKDSGSLYNHGLHFSKNKRVMIGMLEAPTPNNRFKLVRMLNENADEILCPVNLKSLKIPFELASEEDYIFYYFLIAPADNKFVNYGKKFSDDEILEDLKYEQILPANISTSNSVFGLGLRRLMILLFNQGIVPIFMSGYKAHWNKRAGNRFIRTEDQILKLINNFKENNVLPDGFISAKNVFNINDPKYWGYHATTIARLFAYILRPCPLLDLSAEYYMGHSFGLTASLMGSTLEERKSAYEYLIMKYEVVEQLEKMLYQLKNMTESEFKKHAIDVDEDEEFNSEMIAKMSHNKTLNFWKSFKNVAFGKGDDDELDLLTMARLTDDTTIDGLEHSASLWPKALTDVMTQIHNHIKQLEFYLSD